MAVIRGRDINFYITIDAVRQLFCHATDWQLNPTTETLETTGPANGAFKTYIPGMISYTMSIPGVITYTDNIGLVDILGLQLARTTFEWFAGTESDGGLQFTGNAFISTINITSQVNDVFKFDCTAQGTGPLSILKNPIVKSVYLSDTKGVRLPGCPNPYPVGLVWYDGTFIGVATNADDVISLFNEYAASQGGFLQLTSYSGGCDFTMLIAWNSSLSPDFIPAVTGEGFAMAGGIPDEVIGESPDNQNIIGV